MLYEWFLEVAVSSFFVLGLVTGASHVPKGEFIQLATNKQLRDTGGKEILRKA